MGHVHLQDAVLWEAHRLRGNLRGEYSPRYLALCEPLLELNGQILILVEIDPSPVRINSLIQQAKIFDNDTLLV
jgi:hypothetical protein